jgi:DNA topoisomerase-1
MAGEAISAARKAVADRFGAAHLPDKPRQYTSKAKNAQEAHEAIRPTDFTRMKAASGDHARLYELVLNRALASQMAAARLERTVVELASDRAKLRATGQVTLFPGFLALYEEGRDEKAEDEDGAKMPHLARGDRPDKRGVDAVQSFTQPPATLLGSEPRQAAGGARHRAAFDLRGDPADAEGPRVCPARQEPLRAGGKRAARTAFLERFFERYVSFDYTPSSRTSSTTCPEGGSDG